MKKGFTLIEMLVAVALFAIVMTISMGSIVSIVEANRKSRALKTAMSNLNLALESMSKELRFGKNFHCGDAPNPPKTDPWQCIAGGFFISFKNSDGVQVDYQLSQKKIQRRTNSGNWVDLTSSDLVIDNFDLNPKTPLFYVIGTDKTDQFQPRVLITLKSHAGEGKNLTNFTLQTMISQRFLDL